MARSFLILVTLLFATYSCKRSIQSDSADEVNFSFHERNFGASADELLRDDKFKALKVEVQYMTGFKPDRAAVRNLKTFLLKHLHKPAGIIFIEKQIDPIEDTVLSRSQVDELRRANRTVYTKDDCIAIYILYTNGVFQNSHILGQAFRNTSIVIYGRAIKRYEDVFSFPTQTNIETTLLLHEMGHILGLVDKGSSMQENHVDSLHEAHCNDPNCIMYYKISIDPEFGPLQQKKLLSFDEACLADLKNNGGK